MSKLSFGFDSESARIKEGADYLVIKLADEKYRVVKCRDSGSLMMDTVLGTIVGADKHRELLMNAEFPVVLRRPGIKDPVSMDTQDRTVDFLLERIKSLEDQILSLEKLKYASGTMNLY